MSVSAVQNALLLFCDVIESSKYSAVLGMEAYAKQLLNLQLLFKQLGMRYFEKKEDESIYYYDVGARGDEGTIFCVDPDIQPDELLYKAIQFAFELKACVELRNVMCEAPETDVPPQPMDIGIGIHFGKVALIVKPKQEESGRITSVIDHIEGYSINYAKRIESCSRYGKYSRVFLSKDAAALIDGDPIVLERMFLPLKGIDDNTDVYEIRSAFFEEFPLNPTESEDFIQYFTTHTNDIDYINKPWIKALVVSILDSRLKMSIDLPLKSEYSRRLSDLVWAKPMEDDPILLFQRAREYGEQKRHTQKLSYLRQLVELYPNFIHARRMMAEACWEIAKKKSTRSERTFARDIIHEYINKFPQYLSEREIEVFEKISRSLTKSSK